MKFECKADKFIWAVEQVSKARSKSGVTTYLQDIYIELEEHILTLRATNLEIICEKSIPVKGIQNGKTIIKGDILVKTVAVIKNRDENMVCELVEGVFVISIRENVVEIKTTKEEDFPTLPKIGEEICEIPGKTLTNLLREVMFCSATTEIKPEIASIYLYTTEDELVAVATDSYRLAEKKSKIKLDNSLNVLIPSRYIAEILAILEVEEGNIILSKNDGTLTFTKDNLTLSIQTITGNFPDYKQLFPKEFNISMEVKKDDLVRALSITSLFTEQYSPLSCRVEEGKFIIQSRNEVSGGATEIIKGKHEGDTVHAHYNSRYFLDTLPHLEGDTVKLRFTTPNRPVVITGKKDLSYTYLLMPVNR